MNIPQTETLQRLIREVEAAENMRGAAWVEVDTSHEWEDERCVDVTAWAGGVGAPMLIDVDGELCDSEQGPGHPVRLTIVPDTYLNDGSNQFSYEAAAVEEEGARDA